MPPAARLRLIHNRPNATSTIADNARRTSEA